MTKVSARHVFGHFLKDYQVHHTYRHQIFICYKSKWIHIYHYKYHLCKDKLSRNILYRIAKQHITCNELDPKHFFHQPLWNVNTGTQIFGIIFNFNVNNHICLEFVMTSNYFHTSV